MSALAEFYADRVFPRLCHLAMRNHRLLPYRRRVAGMAEGRVLEIGIGSGLNLPLYGPAVREVLALEPAPSLLVMAQRTAQDSTSPLRFIEASAEAIPLDAHSVDTVVTTWTMCSIADLDRALQDMRRVLRPGGRLVFVEHGLAPDAGVRRWQHRITPAWRRISGGCHLDRPIDAVVERAGFRLTGLQAAYMPGPKLLTYFYEGAATPS